MTEPNDNAELDLALLDDWCAFCAGKATFDDYHFSTILMGVFLAEHTPEVDDFIRRFSSAFLPLFAMRSFASVVMHHQTGIFCRGLSVTLLKSSNCLVH